MAVALGIGLLVLQRWVAETRTVAMALVASWFALVALGALIATWKRPELRLPALGTIAVIAVGTGAIGYWTGFRDKEVDEDVVVAAREAGTAERAAGLAPAGDPAEDTGGARKPASVRLLSGSLEGADGHAAGGKVAVVRESTGERRLTLTNFDADPGPMVKVYLARDTSNVDDVVDLGGLKGNVGNQQYGIPADVDLERYDSLILWCVPFTTRIAVAPLG